MGKKNQQKKIAKTTPQTSQKASPPLRAVKKPIKNLWIRIVLVVSVLVMYGNSINYEFTVDDYLFYTKHSSVQKGIAGIPETFTYGSLEKQNGMKGVQPYRPITLTSFAIQKQVFDNSQSKAHLVNVLLYVLLVLVLFNLLLKLLPGVNPMIAGIITLIFAAHPIHTEVAASVKSQDELLSALFAMLSLSFMASLIKQEKYSVKFGVISVICFALALLSKEGAFAMILIFPLAGWLLLSQSVKKSLIWSLPYFAIAMIFLWVRSLVFGGQVQNYHNTILENVLFGAKGFAEITATKMEILFHYLRLTLVPWGLSWDYSYNQVPIVGWNAVLPWVGLLCYGALLAVALLKIKKWPAISFGILFYMIMLAPTANLFFLNGSTVSERFLFIPSLGLIMAVVFGVAKLMKVDIAGYKGPAANKFNWIAAVVALVFVVFTIARSNDWKNNYSIFKAGVENAPKSSRANEAYANELRKMAEKSSDLTDRQLYLEESLKYSKHSLDILPTNKDALYNLGVVYTEMKDTANALAAYYTAISYFPDFRSPLNNLGSIFLAKGQFDSAYKYMKLCYDADTTVAKSSQNLAILYFKLGKYNDAIQFASNAIRLDEKIVVPYDVLSQAYKAIGDPAKAASYQSLYREKYAESVADQKPIVNE